MRNISFQLTTQQVRRREKDVTRRLGWKNLKPGELLRGCVKCMGLKPGEKIESLAVIRVVSVRREPLCDITAEDCVREGFPEMTPAEFVCMFVEHMGGAVNQEITRIEFEYVDEPPALLPHQQRLLKPGLRIVLKPRTRNVGYPLPESLNPQNP